MAKKKKFEPAFDNLPMDQIIGAPLKATASANTMMAREQVKFLMDYCFTKVGDNYQPVMVDMVMNRSQLTPGTVGGDMRRYTMTFSLPLLTLVPLNSLSVETFEIDFDMEVNTVSSSNTHTESTSEENKENTEEVQFMGKISNREQQSSDSQYQRKVNSKLSINVKGGQLPLPVGLTSIIDLFSKNIDPTDIRENDQIRLK